MRTGNRPNLGAQTQQKDWHKIIISYPFQRTRQLSINSNFNEQTRCQLSPSQTFSSHHHISKSHHSPRAKLQKPITIISLRKDRIVVCMAGGQMRSTACSSRASSDSRKIGGRLKTTSVQEIVHKLEVTLKNISCDSKKKEAPAAVWRIACKKIIQIPKPMIINSLPLQWRAMRNNSSSNNNCASHDS